MDVAETRLCLLLHSVPGLGDEMLSRLLLHCGGPRGVAGADRGLWLEAGLSGAVASALAQALRSGRAAGFDIDAQLRALAAVDAQVLALLEGEELVEAVAAQPLAMPELEEALLYLEGQLPELSLLPLWQEQTIMGLLDPAGALLADLFARAAPPITLPGQPFPY